jgi:hypothetical protein
MNRLSTIIGLAALTTVVAATPALAGESTQQVQAGASEGTVQVEKGRVIYSSTGKRLGQVYRVTPEGNPQVVLNSRLVTVPASTLSVSDGKLSTSLTARQLISTR